jgi:hypothetical protein
MNARLSLVEFVGHLQADLPSVFVSHSKVRGYQTLFPTKYPAVWVLAQKTRALASDDEGDGYSGHYRQHMGIEIAVRCVVQRYADGETTSEAPLNALIDNVCNSLKKWQPTGADLPLRIVLIQDGPDHESVSYADVIVGTQTTYSDAP